LIILNENDDSSSFLCSLHHLIKELNADGFKISQNIRPIEGLVIEVDLLFLTIFDQINFALIVFDDMWIFVDYHITFPFLSESHQLI